MAPPPFPPKKPVMVTFFRGDHDFPFPISIHRCPLSSHFVCSFGFIYNVCQNSPCISHLPLPLPPPPGGPRPALAVRVRRWDLLVWRSAWEGSREDAFAAGVLCIVGFVYEWGRNRKGGFFFGCLFFMWVEAVQDGVWCAVCGWARPLVDTCMYSYRYTYIYTQSLNL